MEQFTRECLELDGPTPDSSSLSPQENMKKVYEKAAQLVKSTLDLEGAVVVDVSNFELLNPTEPNAPPTVKRYHGDVFNSNSTRSAVVSASNSPRLSDPLPNDDETDGTNQSAEDFLGSKRHGGHEYGRIPPLVVLGSAEGGEIPKRRNQDLSGDAHMKLAAFLANFPDGRIYERVVPSCFKGVVPDNVKYAMGK